jgi:biotin operon repressor
VCRALFDPVLHVTSAVVHQIIPQWELLRLLFAHQDGVRIEDMANALKTPQRNVYRDIEVLKRAGFNVCKVRRDGTPYYYIPSDELVLPEENPWRRDLTDLHAVRFPLYSEKKDQYTLWKV